MKVGLPSTIDEVLQYLKVETDKEESIYETVKVLGVNEENPDRYFALKSGYFPTGTVESLVKWVFLSTMLTNQKRIRPR